MPGESKKTIKMIAVIEILIAIGIISFWVVFFSGDLVSIKDPKLKEIYLAFESAFPVPDAWLAAALLIGGIGLLKKAYYGYFFSFIGGASLIYLGLLDTSFNILQGMYTLGIGEAVLNIFINLICLCAGSFIILIVWKNGLQRAEGKKENVS
jgi:hypothetical protein